MIKKVLTYCFLILVSIWILGFVFFSVEASEKSKTINLVPYKEHGAIIVLTGGHNRITEGFKLFDAWDFQDMFITGVYEGVTINDLLKTSQFKGTLADCCITLGHKATTTIENAQEVKEWVDGKNIQTLILVTSNYHMQRAVLEFKNAMPDIQIIGYEMQKQDYNVSDRKYWALLLEEYHKVLYRSVVIAITQKKISF